MDTDAASGRKMIDVTLSDWMSVPVEIEAGQVFAVGDVHGMSQHFEALLSTMASEATDDAELVLLGDLIDRGPDSIGVLRHAARPARGLGFARKTVLVGNHELMLLDALKRGPAQLRHLGIWNGNGGSEVLLQADIEPDRAGEHLAELDHLIRHAAGPEAWQ